MSSQCRLIALSVRIAEEPAEHLRFAQRGQKLHEGDTLSIEDPHQRGWGIVIQLHELVSLKASPIFVGETRQRA